MTIGFGALGRGGVEPGAALAGGSGWLAGSSGSGSPITSAIFLPSGDHSKLCRRPLVSVSWYASPPDIGSTQTCEPFAGPGRPEVKARSLPSGLHFGEPSLSMLKVIWRSVLPS